MMKTFVFDLDDTLLNREKRIGKHTRRALIEIARTGSKIIFATHPDLKEQSIDLLMRSFLLLRLLSP
jgi:hydroxymethylpyrimidine pyrophosphatase-like HAD family hydrolase